MADDERAQPPPSPCNDSCVLDANRNLCTGCFRTLDEIASWPLMSDRERARIMKDALPARAEEYRRECGPQEGTAG